MSIGAQAEAALFDATRRIAREEILPRFRALDGRDIDTKKDADDLVTIADKRSEERLTDEIARILPGAAVIGEEAISADVSLLDRIADDGTCAIIDPVDGTWNFANGLGLFGVILAVAKNGETVWGGIYDPLGDDWMVASRGEGARFISTDGVERSLVLAPGPTRASDSRGNLPVFLFTGERRARMASMMPDFLRTVNLRCSAHDYRMQAQGSFDFSICPFLNPWDHAAGCLMVQEAGGVARLLDGRDYQPTHREGCLLVARSEELWSELATKFAEFA